MNPPTKTDTKRQFTNTTCSPRRRHYSIYSIEGNIGSGKSTLMKMMKQIYKDKKHIVFIPEPVDEWLKITDKNGVNILNHFYHSKEEYAFSFQMMAYTTRLKIIRDTIDKNPDATVFITERCLDTDYNIFAKMLYDNGYINEIKYKIYCHMFEQFQENFPITQYIYIRTNPEVSYERVLKRNRKDEDIELSYLKVCHMYHEQWLTNKNNNVCIINGNSNKDFIEDDYSYWISIINNVIEPCVKKLTFKEICEFSTY